MFITEVIPLTHLPQSAPQLFSYFFESFLEKGSVVQVTIGKRKVDAIVISSIPIEKQKSILKKSEFQLKNLTKVISEEPKVSDIQFKTALWLSRTYHAPLSLSLKTVTSSTLSKSKVENKEFTENYTKPGVIASGAKNTVRIINQYIKDVENLPKQIGQVLLIVPDKSILEYFQTELRSKFDENKLILGTRKTLFSQFKNLKLIIVEDPYNEAYKSEMTPKYSTPELAEKVAELYGSKIIFISPLLGVKNYFRIRNGSYNLIKEGKVSHPEVKITNTINNPDLISEDLKENILKTVSKGGKILIFSPRRGFVGLLICQNCNSTIKCPNCSSPMKVHRSTDLNLKCHRCAHTQQFPKFCSNCNSNKLRTAGPAGSQKIYDRVREFLSQKNINIPLLVLDSDVTKNDTEEKEIMETIKKPGSSIVIATQMIFSYRYILNFSLIGVISADSLVSIPDFNIEEKMLYQFKKLADFDPEKIIIQTYAPENQVLKSFESNNLENFYESELEMRQLFMYPPFSRLVKLTYKSKDQKRAFMAARGLVDKFKMAIKQLGLENKIQVTDSTPGFVERERGLYNYHIILKSLTGETPREILKFVPMGWIVDVDPKSTL